MDISWKEQFFEALFPIDERVIAIPYALKRPSKREYLDRILPDRKKTDTDLAFRILEENLPERVYKYRTVSRYSLDNFENDTIWITSPTQFNDPFDSITIENEIDYHNGFFSGVITEETADLLEQIFKRGFIERTQHTFTVACLSETNSSVLMWSHYSDEHKGFCIEYSGKDIYHSSDINKHFFPVKYVTQEEQQLPVSSLALDYSGLYSVLTKTDDWAYEQEWRIAFGLEADHTPRNLQLPKATGVYVGAKITKEDLGVVMEIAKQKGIPIYQEVLDLQRRQLHFKQISD